MKRLDIAVSASVGCLLLLSACAAAASGKAGSSTANHSRVEQGEPDSKPQPPSDLDARLVKEYPLRAVVLQESGAATVRFTVQPSGQVTAGEVMNETGADYGAACQRMLESSRWRPALSAGRPVPYSAVFECTFVHDIESENARSCAATLHLGPHQLPARSTSAELIDFQSAFQCASDATTRTAQASARGPITAEQVTAKLADSQPRLNHCAVGNPRLGPPIQSRLWLAFEIGPDGAIDRIEWLAQPEGATLRHSCILEALRSLHFSPASERTIADIHLDVGG
jgi:hypothetical protein